MPLVSLTIAAQAGPKPRCGCIVLTVSRSMTGYCTTPGTMPIRPGSKHAQQDAHGYFGTALRVPMQAMPRHAAQAVLKDAIVMLKLQVSAMAG